MLSGNTNDRMKEEAGANGQKKDPYYFTFFNEKNENKDAAQADVSIEESQPVNSKPKMVN
jgi:hypothetical protein